MPLDGRRDGRGSFGISAPRHPATPPLPRGNLPATRSSRASRRIAAGWWSWERGRLLGAVLGYFAIVKCRGRELVYCPAVVVAAMVIA